MTNFRDKILKATLDGHCPSEIASQLSTSVKTVIDNLWIFVGRGSLRLTDIYFAYSDAQRIELKAALNSETSDRSPKGLPHIGLTVDEVELFNKLRRQQVVGSEMYEFVSEIELAIHEYVRSVLVDQFGSREEQWWRKGIPLNIRQRCQFRREEDDQPSDSGFAYTNLIDLSVIITKNWTLFQSDLHVDYRSNKKRLQHDFVELNEIRKAVMHPVKQRKWTENDFYFVRRFRTRFWGVSIPYTSGL